MTNRLPLLLLSIIAVRGGNGDVVDGVPEYDSMERLDRSFGRDDELGAVPGKYDEYGGGDTLDTSTALDVTDNNDGGGTSSSNPLDIAAEEGGDVDLTPSASSNSNIESVTEAESEDIEEALDASPKSIVVSVSVTPAIALSFHCNSSGDTDDTSPCDYATVTDSELQVIANAAENLVHENPRLESALGFDVQNEEGFSYEGVDLTASLYTRRHLLASMEQHPSRTREAKDIKELKTRSLRGRNLANSNSNNAVLVSGTLQFLAPSNLSPASDYSSIPSESEISELLLIIFVEEKDTFINEIKDLAAYDLEESSWLTEVVGYGVSFESDLLVNKNDFNSDSNTEGNDVDVDVDVSKTTTDGQAETTDEKGSDSAPGDDGNVQGSENATVIAAANNGIQNQTITGDSTMNLLLIVGAAGAAFSLLLLIGGLCYAKKSYNKNNAGSDNANSAKKANPSESALSPNHNQNDVIFQPGKNNPRSSANINSSGRTSIFKKKSGSKDALEGPAAPPPVPVPTIDPTNSDDDDEDFLLARAALDHSVKKAVNDGDEGSVADSQMNNTFGDDMSYAFTVEGDSLAPIDKTRNSNTSSNISQISEDGVIGAGGMASFANDKGTFRWNEDGTKMVYTPNMQTSGENSSEEQHGFVYDENKKKWVVKERVIGEKNVSFKPSANLNGGGSGSGVHPPSLLRTRSHDSVGTGMSEFTYDDVALDQGKRSRSGGTTNSGGSSITGMNSSFMGGQNNSSSTGSGIPPSPSTPKDQGVEITDEMILQSNQSDDSEFAPNTNVERFMMGNVDDDSTAFSGITDFTNNNSFSANPPPPPPLPPPRPVTPERVPSLNSDAATFATGDPGRIVPKKAVVKRNKMKIAEDKPFDEEDIPFDERTRSTGSANKRTGSGLVIPNILDDYVGEQDHSDSEGSVETANSEQVLEDLNKLSKFMMERKRSGKSDRSVGSSTRRRMKGGGSASGSGRRPNNGNRSSGKYRSDSSRGM